MEDLRSAWKSLWTPELTLFQTFDWNYTAARIFAAREQPYVIFAESDSGAAIIPAVIDSQSKQVRFLGDCLFDYRDYLARGSSERVHAAWERIAGLHLPLNLLALRRPQAPIWNDLPLTPYSGAPYLSSSTLSTEQFAADHSRKESRLRKLFRLGVVLKQYNGSDEKLVRTIYESKARQEGEGNLFLDPLRIEFMAQIAKIEAERCEIFVFEKDAHIVAALITFRDAQYRRFYTTYYDHEWARYSPGVELLFEVTRRSLEEHVDFDFMTGEQAYKMRIATSVMPLYRMEASPAELEQAVTALGRSKAAA